MNKVRMTIRLVPKLNNQLKKASEELGKSKNSLIVDACWKFVQKYNNSKKKEV